MKKLVLVMGDLAAGKTTFAKKIANKYKIACYNKDSIKEIASNNLPYNTKEESRKLSILAVEVMIDMFKECCEYEMPLILEANFHQDEIYKLHNIANENGYDVLTLLFQADIDILHKRFVNRAENENRHPVHLSHTLKEFEEFKNYIETSRNEKPIGKVIKINANSFTYQDDETLLKEIENFINN